MTNNPDKPNIEQHHFDASSISWKRVNPAHIHGSYHQTDILEKCGAQSMKVASSSANKTASTMFLLAGIVMIIVGLIAYSKNTYFLLVCPFGMIFVISSVRSLYFTQSAIFDKASGYFWVGPEKLNVHEVARLSVHCKISHIKAIQTLKKNIKDVDGDYYSYELNIVLKNGQRFNVIDSGGSKEANIAEAKKLGFFLGAPTFSGDEE